MGKGRVCGCCLQPLNGGWIPASDPPEAFTKVICSAGGSVFMGTIDKDGRWWNNGAMLRVAGWMPKPLPLKESEE